MPLYIAHDVDVASKALTALGDNLSTELWSVGPGGNGYSVALDQSGRVWFGHAFNGVSTCLRCYSDEGALIRSVSALTAVRAIGVAPDGSVFAASDSLQGGIRKPLLYKVNPDTGAILWSKTDYYYEPGRTIAFVGTNVVVGVAQHNTYSRDDFYCFRQDTGGRISDVQLNRGIYSLSAVDAQTLYAACWDYYTYREPIKKLDFSTPSSGPTVLWAIDLDATMYATATDDAGDLYVAGMQVGGATTRKYSAAGSLIWSHDHGADVYTLVYSGGTLYAGGAAGTGGYRLRTLNADTGAQIGAWIGTATIRGIAVVVAPAEETDVPGLALPLALAMPRMGATLAPPGLAFALRLGLPRVTEPLSPPPRPSTAARSVFRLYFNSIALSAPVEFPLASFQCERRLGASTWLYVEIPYYDAGALAQLRAAGGELRIMSGYEGLPLGEMLMAIVTDTDATETGTGGSIRVTARVQTPYYTPQAVTLHGVTDRTQDNVRRTVRCAVDPSLRPNDTVDDGEGVWTVGAIKYRVTPLVAQMTVTEALNG